MADEFADVVRGVYLEGEEQAIEKVVQYEVENEECYKFFAKGVDRALEVCTYHEAVIDALEQHVAEIRAAFEGGDESGS